ncbi:MAG TPA: preprotein translocase subunit SecE [Saprospirales bacterium]|jgi:preprotein translocase subunit SecE|nr:preprotein translocase subunit SecE [Saprospirales bacterium]
MEKLTLYLKESYHELTKEVHWPTAAQLQESTLVVLTTSAILALMIFFMDNACGIIIKKGIYGL